MSATITRPVLRWFGGKMGKAGFLADWILAHVPSHECYVEPFGGGGNVLLRKPRSHNEVYNDLFGEVCALFRVLADRDAAAELARLVSLTPYAEPVYEASFVRPAAESDLELARRLLVRSWMSFGTDAASSYRPSGFRGGTNTVARDPGLDWRGLPAALSAAADRLQGVHVYQRPYEWVLDKYDGERTAFYVDPPYLHETRSPEYLSSYHAEMSEADHVTLADRLRALRGFVTLSGYDSDLYGRLYADWTRVERTAHVNGNKDRERVEMLWLNPAAARSLPQQSLFA